MKFSNLIPTPLRSKNKSSSSAKVAADDVLLDTSRHSQKLNYGNDLANSKLFPVPPATSSTSVGDTTEHSLSLSSSSSSSSSSDSASLSLTYSNDEKVELVVGWEELKKENRHQQLKSSTSSAEAASVRFSTVQVRVFPICIGDNPSSARGPPISMEWNHVDAYEHPVSSNKKRSLEDLKMTSLDRAKMLHNAGYSCKEIARAVKTVNRDRSRRRRTNARLQLSKSHEFIEVAWRGFQNATFLRSQKQKEREYLRPYYCRVSTKDEKELSLHKKEHQTPLREGSYVDT